MMLMEGSVHECFPYNEKKYIKEGAMEITIS